MVAVKSLVASVLFGMLLAPAAFADTYELAAGAGSDAHVPAALGAAYVEMPDFDGPVEFLAALREGVVVGHHFDLPRPWRARIVPSTTAT